MTLVIDPEMVPISSPSVAVLPGMQPLSERIRLARRRRRMAGTRDLIISAGFSLSAIAGVAVALFSLIGR